MKKLYYVYSHTRPDTGEVFYIGVGRMNSKRAWEIRKRNSYWTNVVNKNNGDFTVEILFIDLTKEEAELKEIELISTYGRKRYGGGTLVNHDPGGKLREGYVWTEEEKQYLGSFHIGNKYTLGFKHSEESKQKMSLQRKGKPSLNKGKKASEETRKKQSEAHKGNPSNTNKISITNGIESKMITKDSQIPEGWYRGGLKGYKLSEEFRKKCSENKKGKPPNLTEEQRLKRSENAKGNNGSSGKMWINNTIESKYILTTEPIPDGWFKGRIRTWVNQFNK